MATTPAARVYLRDRLDDPDAYNPDACSTRSRNCCRINAASNLSRRVVKDIELGGVSMKRNGHVLLPNTITNRDPGIFEDPDAIDLDWKINRHLTFGVGPHRCMGSHLAKRAMLVGIKKWLLRIPEFTLGEMPEDGNAFGGPVMGFNHLPLV